MILSLTFSFCLCCGEGATATLLAGPGAGVYPGCAGQSLASHQVLTQTLSEQETPEDLATNEPMSYPPVNALRFQMTQCPLSSLAITPTDRNEKGNQFLSPLHQCQATTEGGVNLPLGF